MPPANFLVSIDTGSASKAGSTYSAFGFSGGGQLRIFPYCPGEKCITIEGTKADIEIVFDKLRVPKEQLQKIFKENGL